MPAWWDRFWHGPGSALNLAAARVIFALQTLWILLSRDFAAFAGFPGDYWAGVSNLGRWRFLAFPGHPGLEQALQWVAVVALACAALGILPRLACLVSGLLVYHFAAMESLLWTHSAYSRGLTISVLGLLVLAAAPSGDALRLWPRRGAPAGEPWEYQWGLTLVQVLVVVPYFFAGYAKLFHVAGGWLSGDTVRQWIYLLSVDDEVAVFRAPGLWLAEHPALCALIGVGTVLFELGFMTVLFWRRARLLLVPLALVFHVVVAFTLNIFWLNTPQLLVFVNWERIRGLTRR